MKGPWGRGKSSGEGAASRVCACAHACAMELEGGVRRCWAGSTPWQLVWLWGYTVCGKPREQVYSCARLYSARACMYYVACATR